MDAPADAKQVEVGPGLSVAAQAATVTAAKINAETGPAVPDIRPVDVVDKQFAESIGIKTKGWTPGAAKVWYREHSTQIWTAATVVDMTLVFLLARIPSEWVTVTLIVKIAAQITGTVLKYRNQLGVVLARLRGEVANNTPE